MFYGITSPFFQSHYSYSELEDIADRHNFMLVEDGRDVTVSIIEGNPLWKFSLGEEDTYILVWSYGKEET